MMSCKIQLKLYLGGLHALSSIEDFIFDCAVSQRFIKDLLSLAAQSCFQSIPLLHHSINTVEASVAKDKDRKYKAAFVCLNERGVV